MKLIPLILAVVVALPASGARRLTLDEAQALALKQNRALKLARLKIDESEHKRLGARTDFFPHVTADANDLYFSRKLGVTLTGNDLGLGFLPPPFPSVPIPLTLVKQDILFGGATVLQPVTPLLKVRQAVNAAAGDEAIAKAQLEKGERDVEYGVEQLYYGLLTSLAQKKAAELKVAAAEEQLRDVQNAVDTGTTLPVSAIGQRAALLEARQSLLELTNQMADYTDALNTLIGLPAGTELELEDPPKPDVRIASAEEAVQRAFENSPDVHEAVQVVVKARAGVAVARTDFIPDVYAIGQYFYQSGVPTLPGNFAAVGGRLSWTLFDWGKRNENLKENRARLDQADENLRRVKENAEVEVRKRFRNVDRAVQMVGVAREAAQLRAEGERLNKDQFELGLAKKSVYLESQAARASADADLLRAEAGWRLAYADLKRTIGIP